MEQTQLLKRTISGSAFDFDISVNIQETSRDVQIEISNIANIKDQSSIYHDLKNCTFIIEIDNQKFFHDFPENYKNGNSNLIDIMQCQIQHIQQIFQLEYVSKQQIKLHLKMQIPAFLEQPLLIYKQLILCKKVTQADGEQCFSVIPKQNCPHMFTSISYDYLQNQGNIIKFGQKCAQSVCSQNNTQPQEKQGQNGNNIAKESNNWICLKCFSSGCSRYDEGHAKLHYQTETDHCIAVCSADLSVWCYVCEQYLQHSIFEPILIELERQKFMEAVPRQTTIKNYNNFRTGLFYENQLDLQSVMHLHCKETKAVNPIGMERPERIIVPSQYLMQINVPAMARPVHSIEIGIPVLSLAHSEEYIKSLISDTKSESNMYFKGHEDAFLNENTYSSVLSAVGGLLSILQMIYEEKSIDNGFALIRPPGHHAKRETPSGGCVVNNVAIAARFAKRQYGVQKVTIVDWDFHHGDGIQEIFYNEADVQYISIHSFEIRKEQVFSTEGLPNKVGLPGGSNINIPLVFSEKGYNDIDYLTLFKQLVMPAICEFSPQLILVACGFDAADHEPIWNYHLSPLCFFKMTAFLREFCQINNNNCKLVMALEGGYNLDNISLGTEACIKSLMGMNVELFEQQQNIQKKSELQENYVQIETLISMKYVLKYQASFIKAYQALIKANLCFQLSKDLFVHWSDIEKSYFSDVMEYYIFLEENKKRLYCLDNLNSKVIETAKFQLALKDSNLDIACLEFNSQQSDKVNEKNEIMQKYFQSLPLEEIRLQEIHQIVNSNHSLLLIINIPMSDLRENQQLSLQQIQQILVKLIDEVGLKRMFLSFCLEFKVPLDFASEMTLFIAQTNIVANGLRKQLLNLCGDQMGAAFRIILKIQALSDEIMQIQAGVFDEIEKSTDIDGIYYF